LLATNVWPLELVAAWRPRFLRCGLATEIFPLAQNENSKKNEQLTENLAMSFARCYLLFFPFCFESKQVESISNLQQTLFRVLSIMKI
jgi:hypothetical protein